MEIRDAITRSLEKLRVGLSAQFEREITEKDVVEFARNSGDQNPLHVDTEYARSTNLAARVVHGAYQVALASAMAGMYLPGKNSLLVSCNAQFNRPLYFPCRVAVQGEIIAWDPGGRRGDLRVIIVELPSGIASSHIHLGFTCHEAAHAEVRPVLKEVWPSRAAETKTVLITGASGGIGSYLVRELAGDYSLLALVNRHNLSQDLAAHPQVLQLRADLSERESLRQIEEKILGERLFAIIHAAWPGVPRGGLLAVPYQAIEQQLAFAVFRTIELGRILANSAESDGARFVIIGSVAGTHKPSLNTAAYSLAKAALDQTIKLLAPELALKRITVNAICPSFVPVGINLQTTEREKLVAKAAVPLGRLCDPSDVLGAVRYLFSNDSSFVTGQSILLSGGQL